MYYFNPHALLKARPMSTRSKVVSYNPNWPTEFEAEANHIKELLGQNCVAIHHVGSTSVPGLPAKPQVDIIVAVNNLPKAYEKLEKRYIPKGEFNIPFHMVFGERPGNPLTNIHVYEEGNPEIELNLLFRNYLRTHPEAVKKYADLKLTLDKRPESHVRGSHGFRTYTLKKDAFIKNVLNKAGFQGICMRRCTHYDEWEAAKRFRQKYFFDKVPIEDPYTWTFEHKDHVHFVLYEGTRIVGYAHLQLWPEQRAALRIIVIDEDIRSKGLGSHFLKRSERWLQEQGYQVLLTESSPKAYAFYKQNGYTEMPFNDPEGEETHPDDIAVGKRL